MLRVNELVTYGGELLYMFYRFHCQFWPWNFCFGTDFGCLEFLARLACLISFCFHDLSRSFLFGFGFSFSCLWRLLDLTVFQTPISGFLGFTIFGFDLFCETLGEAVRPVGEPVRLVAVQPAPLPLFCCPPSVEVLDLVSVLLLGDFGSTISAWDGWIVSWQAISGNFLQELLADFSITDSWITGTRIELASWSIKCWTRSGKASDKISEDCTSFNRSIMDGGFHFFILMTPYSVLRK